MVMYQPVKNKINKMELIMAKVTTALNMSDLTHEEAATQFYESFVKTMPSVRGNKVGFRVNFPYSSFINEASLNLKLEKKLPQTILLEDSTILLLRSITKLNDTATEVIYEIS